MPQALFVGIGLGLESAFGAFLVANSAFLSSASLLLGGLALSASQAKRAKRKARAEFNAAQVDRLTNVNTTVGPRELVLGRVRKGGNVFFRGSTGSNRTTFVMLVALASHEIDAVETIYLNDQAVTLDGSGNVQEAPYAIGTTTTGTAVANGSGIATLDFTPIAGSVTAYFGTQGGPDGDVVQVNASVSGLTVTTTPGANVVYQYTAYAYHANIRAVLGSDTQAADAATVALFPGTWTAAHRARGVAYLVCTFQYSETAFPNGLPTVTATIRGAKVYDPRENLLLRSRAFGNASWTKTNCTVTATNTVANFDGSLTADHITSTGDGYLNQSLAANASTTYTFSVWLSAPSPVAIALIVRTVEGAYVSYADTVSNISVTTTMQRFVVTVTTRSIDTQLDIIIGGYSTFTSGEQLYIGDAQLVQGSLPKANTVTTTAAVVPVTAWSDNPALLARHVYQHAAFGKATPTADEDDRIITAANACDTSTGYVVGATTDTQKLYRAALVVPFGSQAKDVFDDLAQAMGGFWAFAGGSLYVKAGTWTSPVMALTDSDLAVVVRKGVQTSARPIGISTHRQRVDKFNTVNVQIWDAGQDYKQVALTPLTDAALVTADGASLVQSVSYEAIGYAPQALHVAGIMMRDARDPLTVTIPFKLRVYPVEIFDNVTLTLSRYGWSAKEFQVLGREWTAEGALALTLKETAASIFTLDAAFSAQGGADNTTLPSPWYVPPIGALTITSGTTELVRQADGTIKSRMRVSWPTITDSSVTDGGSVEIQYREAISTGEWASVQIAGNESQVVITDVQDAVYYLVRARARNRLAVGDWSAHVSHQVIGKTEPPDPFDSFLVLAQPDGTRQFNFGYTSAAPLDWRGAEIRYIAGTDAAPDWDAMTPLVDEDTFFTASPVELNAPLAGEWTFACKSVDRTGNKSTYLVQSITLPDRRLGSVFAQYFEHTEGWLGTPTGLRVAEGWLQAETSLAWSGIPGNRWNSWPVWAMAIYTGGTYETPVRDFGAVIVGSVANTIDADGDVTFEMATSTDGTTWSSWTASAGQFTTRYFKQRITVDISVSGPYPLVRSWTYAIAAVIKSEYINDLVISSLTGSYRIGTGDIRIPLVGDYATIKKTDVVIQDSSAGSWTWQRIDQTLTYGPRIQFRLNGTLTDPAFVDFYIEGY